MGVKTVQLTAARGHLAGARVVRDGYQVMLISTGGTVIKMPVEDVKRLGRSTQGVIVMRLREGEQVSSLAPVVESGDDAADTAVDGAILEETAVDAVSEDAADDATPDD
jgi:DNA gyrase subunit A